MKIIIDGDACPVIDITIAIANEYQIEVILVSDFNHALDYEGIRYIQVDQGSDASDHQIFALCEKKDIIITSDGGLANLILGKQGIPISFSGYMYTSQNIEQILNERYLNAKARKAKQRFKHIAKRTKKDDEQFIITLTHVIETMG
ncbi:MAG: YaiI/YqxD family protein [Erysipelotrichia bacterium]|nr:YaiI/YqxD family protein [Erysipelotrichia bacterium]NCC54068.1 YaiI/YqxD family protein [Erysipelotrichia bacterium]